MEKKNQNSFRSIALAAAILVFLVIVLGGVIRASGTPEACPNWPACNGSWLPPRQPALLVDYLHRLAAFLLAPALLALGILTWRHYRYDLRISLPAYAALILLVAQVLLGGLLAFQGAGERQPVTALHLGLSLLILALVLAAAVVAYYREAAVHFRGFAFRTPFARLSILTLAAGFLLLVSGALVAGTSSGAACSTWPLCNGSWIPSSPGGWINLIHRLSVAFSGLLVALLVVQAWRTQRTQAPILVAATSAGVLFLSQALMGSKMTPGFPLYLLGLHEATAAAVWASLVITVVATGMAARTAEEEAQEAREARGRKGLARDFLMLTKPVVVLLLLVTTFAGMVIGARAWPSLSLVFWTLFGGALAAGGSGAINQYIDRYDDVRMQRTQKRPIPSGRMAPAEGLAFGVALCLASFFVLVAFVNLLAALLSLAGIIYYVLLYSIFLKKATVQNIVIGGGAGAIPPLVGWAAATGSLNIPSLFLFAVIFMWTPPHFWALAIVRRSDYARAGVPMLPVVRGEKEARLQILIYTAELVGLTLLLPLFGLGSSLYLVLAALLGGWLLYSAYQVWRKEGNKVAWKMYRYSSMYLAFLFFALMIDRLIIH
ncbi:MAG: heme o synthase [Omnitrophica WOR_2 bacterium]